jgi:hypothetical protein
VLLTGTKSGLLTTIAWSSDFDPRLMAAGRTLANLAASIVFWIALRNAKSASVRWRFFLLTRFAFNLFEAGAKSGLLWLRYYIPKGTVPRRRPDGIERSYVWITVGLALSLPFVFVLGRGNCTASLDLPRITWTYDDPPT